MATKEVRLCDVFGLEKGVHEYTFALCRTGDGPGGGPFDSNFNVTVDLSDRAVKRAVKLLERAVTPPAKRPRN